MTPATPPEALLAGRTRKARRNGTCTLCPAAVIIGQRIGLIPAGWAHVTCIIESRLAAHRELSRLIRQPPAFRPLEPPPPLQRIAAARQAAHGQRRQGGST